MQVRSVTHGLPLHEVIGCLSALASGQESLSLPLEPSINVYPPYMLMGESIIVYCLWGKHSVALCSNTLWSSIDVQLPPLFSVSDKSSLSLQHVIEFSSIVCWHTIRPCSLAVLTSLLLRLPQFYLRNKSLVSVAGRYT